jgi:hypothetical protein
LNQQHSKLRRIGSFKNPLWRAPARPFWCFTAYEAQERKMYPSSQRNAEQQLELNEMWARVAGLVPYAGMEDKLFWRRLEARKDMLEHASTGSEASSAQDEGDFVEAVRSFEARLRENLAVRLALLGDQGRGSSKVA